LVAGIVGEPAQDQVETILRRNGTSISALNLAEVIDVLVRVRHHRPDVVRERVDLLVAAGLEVEPVWLRVTWIATSLRAKHYHRDRVPVSTADCMCIATAIALETDLATTERALALVAHAAGVDVIALPDSNGELP
jgi:predicted nucleic acid-binding protein